MTYEPRIIAFLCNWCSYTGADTAGIARMPSPYNVRALRVPCSGRVSPELVMRSFDQGADGVIILGCHIGECHYGSGNHRAAKRMPVLREMMSFVGLDPQRLRLDWVSASEGERFSTIVTEFTEAVRSLGPVRWLVSDDEWHLETEEEIQIANELSTIGAEWEIADLEDMQTRLREKARGLLKSGQVDCVIGYERGPRDRTRPAFIYEHKDADRLVWDQTCTHNLTTYLKDKLSINGGTPEGEKPRVAVVLKPCDSKSINVMLSEKRFEREQLFALGVVCDGVFQGAGFGKSNGEYQARCTRCNERVPLVYDSLIGEPRDLQAPLGEEVDADLAYLEGLSSQARTEFWLSQFDRCIRCYACRQVCPVCDCPTCLYERDDSLWTGMNIEINEKRTFHLGRAYHLAGRCVGCDECERVCPMEIPISLLNRKIAQEMLAEFDFQAGINIAPTPMTTELGGQS